MTEQEKDALLERLVKEYAEKDKFDLTLPKITWVPKPSAPTGWICPKCGRGMAPSAHHCPCVPLPVPVPAYGVF